MSDDEPKIIVDDDWKAQVEKEKSLGSEPPPPANTVDSAGETPPPATFETLVTMLFTQALAALGQLPGPDGSPGSVNKPFAKYFIDSLEMLGEKTKGNLSDEESQMVSEALHAMRMAYVSVKAK